MTPLLFIIFADNDTLLVCLCHQHATMSDSETKPFIGAYGRAMSSRPILVSKPDPLSRKHAPHRVLGAI